MNELNRHQQDPDQVRSGKIAGLGKELMDCWNDHKRPSFPAEIAVLGHDTSTGYEFFIERDGETYTLSITLGSE